MGKRSLSYWTILITLFVLLLAMFFAVQAAGFGILIDPTPWLEQHKSVAALTSLSLLIGDVILPVPSSIIMTANGAVFGFTLGTLLSVTGSVCCSMVGFAMGRIGSKKIVELVHQDQNCRFQKIAGQWGFAIIMATRPIPLIAEVVAINAGISELSWLKMAIASFLGAVPSALLYSYAGANFSNRDYGIWVFGATLFFSALYWLVGKRLYHLDKHYLNENK